ncbi:uncharacterized protein LOC135831313 [Planococcus citri]|uniref:uncharacterized protein LOC135831313 n=1 Tax=Planococcus citri TaxID=170843 RepID=UPI0031F8F53E
MFGVKYKCVGGTRSTSSNLMVIHVVILVFCMCGVVTSVQIRHFFTPDKANLKSPDPMKLECDLEYNTTEKRQIIVQWFLNDTLLYQWTENRTTGPFINKHYLDPSASKIRVQNSAIYAPIVITNKTIHHTGWYKCVANSDVTNDETWRDFIQMYVPVDNITLDQVFDNNTNELNVTCGTEDVYPEPQIKLVINGQDNMTIEPILDVRIKENQLFDITATYKLPINDLSASSKINCSIILPDVHITSSRLMQYNKSGYVDDDIITDGNVTTDEISTQDPNAQGGSIQNLINSYLISMSVFVILTLAREFF